MTDIISMKRTSKGNFAIIVGEEFEAIAMKVFVEAMRGISSTGIGGGSGKVGTLSGIAKKVRGADAGVKMSLNPLHEPPKALSGINGLSEEKQGIEIIAYLAERIPNYHHSKLRTFYAELERDTGAPLYAKHKVRYDRLRSSELGKYPNRKIDTAIELIGAERVFDFARRYVQ